MILGVAFKFANGETVELPKPNRHHHIIRHLHDTDRGNGLAGTKHTQGFVDEKGNFLDREEAARHAREIGQIGAVKRTNPQHVLFSEDLW